MTLNTIALELVAPNVESGREQALEEAHKVLRCSAEAGLEGRIRHVMIPGMIEEDDDRPIEMKPKMDVLEFWTAIRPELAGVNGLCTQVTAFMDKPALRQRLTDLSSAGFDGIAFVGVPRTMNDGEGSGVAPTDALSIYDDLVPNRGVILIPTREGEHGRFNFKCDQGATYGMTQLLYSDAIVGFLREFAEKTDHRPEILLSFGFVPKMETNVGLDQLADPGSGQRRGRRRAGVRQAVGRHRARREAQADGRSVQAGDRRRRRTRLPVEHPPRGDLRGLHTGVLDVRRDARLLVARQALTVSEPSVAELRKRLDGLTIRDAARLGRRLKNLRGAGPDKLRKVAEQIASAEGLVATRLAAVPTITYPDLPVSERRDEIAKAISDHQVVIVAGETGSGKTTQLPKICLELGRGIRGTIGHTQPRRLAARTVGQRIADELGTPLGEAVGYTVRFTDQASDRTLVKLMTDGILLAEIQRDRRLLRYDTLILDEAHERSLNIDFLLGYLRELLPRRPDLKVIVTSATIEPERFAAHFGGIGRRGADRRGVGSDVSGRDPVPATGGSRAGG